MKCDHWNTTHSSPLLAAVLYLLQVHLMSLFKAASKDAVMLKHHHKVRERLQSKGDN